MISWFTNVAAPYRVPIWDHIEKQHPLRVHLLETRESLEREGRRPGDWGSVTGSRYQWVPNITLRRGERSFYVSKRFPVLPRGTRAVLLGAWESPLYWQVLLEAKLRRVRTVGFYESTLASNRHRRGPAAAVRAAFFKSLDAVVVPGRAAGEALESFGVVSDRIHIGFNAVNVSSFSEAAAGSSVDHGPDHRFVFVGQLIPRKNPLALLRAFSEAKSGDATLTYIGSGEQQAELEAEASRLGLRDSVFFIEPMSNSELADQLHSFDTLVLPSEEEVWGLVVNEALAAGLKVVVSEQAGVASSVDGMTGVRVTSTSLAHLVAALSWAEGSGTQPIDSPEILEHTPERFAEVFIAALLGETKVN
jgi:glycosyltransferase involved in cell wall biosynthesis